MLSAPVRKVEWVEGAVKSNIYMGGASHHYSICAMQGWRAKMEDAHSVVPKFDVKNKAAHSSFSSVPMFTILDGHGGPEVSSFVSRHIKDVMSESIQSLSEDVHELGVRPNHTGGSLVAPNLKQNLFNSIHGKFDQQLNFPWLKNEKAERTGSMTKKSKNANKKRRTSKDKEELGTRHLDTSRRSSSFGSRSRHRSTPANKKSTDTKRSQSLGKRELKGLGNNTILNALTDIQNSFTFASPWTECVKPKLKGFSQHNQEGIISTTDLILCKAIEKSYMELDTMLRSGEYEHELFPDHDASSQQLHSVVARPQAGQNPTNNGARFVGSAALSVCLSYGTIITAWVGDCRAVLSRGGKAFALSRDHKPDRRSEKTRIRNANGSIYNMPGEQFSRVTRPGSSFALSLTRAIGDLEFKADRGKPQESQIVISVPDFRVEPLKVEDEFIIMACDGIWDVVSNDEAVSFVRNRILHYRTAFPDNGMKGILQRVGQELCHRCCSHDPYQTNHLGTDNMTVAVVMLNGIQNETAFKAPRFQQPTGEAEPNFQTRGSLSGKDAESRRHFGNSVRRAESLSSSSRYIEELLGSSIKNNVDKRGRLLRSKSFSIEKKERSKSMAA